jgi:molybdenum cofactor cytidylyltransferase
MGTPKLLLLLEGRPLIRHTMEAWRRSKVERIAIVVRSDDAELIAIVAETAANEPRIHLVIPPRPPPDMKVSIQMGLRHVEQQDRPSGADAFLVAPSDMPRLSSAVIDALLDAHRGSPDRILVPTVGARRGHPVLLPWSLAGEVHALAPEEGLDAVVHRHEPLLIPCERLLSANESAFDDVDTPAEYQRLTDEHDPAAHLSPRP